MKGRSSCFNPPCVSMILCVQRAEGLWARAVTSDAARQRFPRPSRQLLQMLRDYEAALLCFMSMRLPVARYEIVFSVDKTHGEFGCPVRLRPTLCVLTS